MPAHSWGIKFVNGVPLPDPHYHYDDDLGFGYYDEFWGPACCDYHRSEYEKRGRGN
ncbi:hypothetical protein [Mycolicibacterium fluoranthenivorans]|uniref:Uncharacterized protein n=1 Tax=Mycolicibacterium fluoranthenivorans TaxID=258505 RepID=A0A7X5U497_9MYCO|nr:hypothetical protein [Mycolicibacterium fluoranthenivorans]MCV7358498.1 hypothetical protein [Mycolicibacterium fluoranthenivorans]NIH98074.1 hypothetical protein [Mycolicibacterium fluoranthenivorans]